MRTYRFLALKRTYNTVQIDYSWTTRELRAMTLCRKRLQSGYLAIKQNTADKVGL